MNGALIEYPEREKGELLSPFAQRRIRGCSFVNTRLHFAHDDRSIKVYRERGKGVNVDSRKK